MFDDDKYQSKIVSDDVSPLDIEASVQESQFKAPGIGESAFSNLVSGLNAIPEFAFNTESAVLGIKRQDPYKDIMQNFNSAMESQTLGWSQKTAGFIGNVVGMSLNPVNLLAGGAVGEAVGVGISALSDVLPEAVSAFGQTTTASLLGEEAAKRMPEFLPKTLGEVGSNLAKTFAEASAVSVPQAFNENFNDKTGKFDIIGGAEQTLKYGALGLGLHALGMTAGAIYGKIGGFKASGKMPKLGDASKDNLNEIDSAFQKGKINEDEYKWLHTYLTEPNKLDEMHSTAIKILESEKYNVDSVNNKVFMQIASKDTIDSLHSSIFDQLASNTTGDLKTALSDYQHLNIMDAIKSDSGHMVNGLKGFVSFIDDRLLKQDENLSILKKTIDKGAYSHINSDHPMSEKSIVKRLKNNEVIPNAITKNIADKTPLAPTKEIKNLESHFFDNDLKDNFQDSIEYQRLKDLSLFSENAKALLHYVDLKHEYEIQNAYKGMVDSLTKIMDGDISKYADPKKVQAYLENRLSEDVGSIKDMGYQNERSVSPEKDFRDKSEENSIDDLKDQARNNVDHAEEFEKYNDQDIRKSGAKDLEADNRQTMLQYKQYKQSMEDGSRENLVSCVRG